MRQCVIAMAMVLLASMWVELRAEQPSTQPAAVERITLYAALVRPGPTWLANQEAGRRNDMTRHVEYVTRMRAEGKLVLGGPFADGAGGLLVYRADSIEQARQFMDADPATVEKVFDYDMHPWSVNAADLPRK